MDNLKQQWRALNPGLRQAVLVLLALAALCLVSADFRNALLGLN
jgi:hypothetical protein